MSTPLDSQFSSFVIEPEPDVPVTAPDWLIKIGITEVVACPCCHGKGYLVVHDENGFNPPMRLPCCHCSGHGMICDRGQLPNVR